MRTSSESKHHVLQRLHSRTSSDRVEWMHRRRGQVPRDPTTCDVPASFDAQAQLTLENVRAVVQAAGSSLTRALKVNVYLSDLANIDALDPVYREFFTEPFPARTTVQAGLRGYLIEVDAIVAVAKG